ncbi:MAG TPA: PP2C family serine/threonine-protein phosphatase [Ktedonobacteraceae bacterium]|jgi:protein phosphatase
MQIDQHQALEESSKIEQRFTFARCTVPHAEHPERNEDTILIERRRGLAAVFDGVGSVAHADVASRTAARCMRSGWRRALAFVQQLPGILTTEQTLDVPSLLCSLVENARLSIRAQGELSVQEDGSETLLCGETTIAFAVLCLDLAEKRSLLYYAHVGDSRVYLLSQGKPIRRLTRDDGYFALQMSKELMSEQDAQRIDQASSADELTEEEKGHFEKRNGITQSLGLKEIEVHTGCTSLLPGDRVLLCTDGLHDNLTDKEIEEIVRNSARTSAAHALIQQAIVRSQQEHLRAKKDDMSAVVITCLV